MAGIQPLAPSFDTLGVFTREAATLARVAGVLWSLGQESPPARRVLMLEEGWALADDEIKALRPLVTDRLAAIGVAVEAVALAELVGGELGSKVLADVAAILEQPKRLITWA